MSSLKRLNRVLCQSAYLLKRSKTHGVSEKRTRQTLILVLNLATETIIDFPAGEIPRLIHPLPPRNERQNRSVDVLCKAILLPIGGPEYHAFEGQ